jgi:NTP pyrophosphatase (non-canonical NTP hydrolase)
MSWSKERQETIADWVETRIGLMSQADPAERTMRVLEEAVELAQANGIGRREIERLADYVYGRPKGKPGQEIAGVGVTLLALAECLGLDLVDEIDSEIERIHHLPPDHFRKRQQEKADAGIASRPARLNGQEERTH